jgi:VanZ family protein
LTRRVLTAGGVTLVVAGAIEAGQIFTPTRIASAVDVASQVVGSMSGAFLAHVGRGAMSGAPMEHRLLSFVRRRPAVGPLAVLIAILMADALYPYVPTLDVSTVWASLKHIQWSPLPAGRPWHTVLVEQVLPYGVLGALAAAAFSPTSPAAARGPAGAACVAWAAGLETAKLFIEGRSPDVSHVAAAAIGALAGVLAVRDRFPAPRFLAGGAVCLMIYAELTPFDFTWPPPSTVGIEWLPFASYYHSEPTQALFDAGKKLLLGGLLGASLRAATVRTPAVWAGGLALLLEAGQLVEASHHAALGDVLILTAGSAGGAVLLTRYRAMLDSA